VPVPGLCYLQGWMPHVQVPGQSFYAAQCLRTSLHSTYITAEPKSSTIHLHTICAESSFALSVLGRCPFVGHVSGKLQEDSQHAVSSRSVKKLGVGLRVGKTRYPAGKRRHQARTRAASHAGSGSAHRRCTGARLQPKRYVEPRILSFDPSRLEMKRQVGLRTSSSAHTHSGRESSTPCTSKGLTSTSCALSFSSNFQAIMDDKLIELPDS